MSEVLGEEESNTRRSKHHVHHLLAQLLATMSTASTAVLRAAAAQRSSLRKATAASPAILATPAASLTTWTMPAARSTPSPASSTERIRSRPGAGALLVPRTAPFVPPARSSYSLGTQDFLKSIHPASAFHTSAGRPYHFDTHHFVRRLQESGMEHREAEVLVEVLADVIDESIRNLSEGMVAREEGEKWRYTQKVDFARLKSEIQLLERNDFVLMKTENERLMADVEKLKQRLREEITRTTAGVRLDLNLEKGRIRDESSVHALKIKEVDTRIESEIAGLRTSIQSAKFNVLQYLVGVATGAGALLLAYLRMFR
ncbi:hypothetical protein V8E36_002870 [Tilletia maclaganii]